MRMERSGATGEYKEIVKADLQLLMAQPDRIEVRPCATCLAPCSCSGSTTCTCDCATTCERAPLAMSSEGDRYPIEAPIASLVFSLKALGVCPPYWSCGGHIANEGGLRRGPQVWFYTTSVIYPKLINEFVQSLKTEKQITNTWQVAITYTDELLSVGFCLQPDLAGVDQPDLVSMQRDANIIAAGLGRGMKAIAWRYLTESNGHG